MNLCKLCGSENISISKKIKSPINKYVYTLYRCGKCGSCLFNAMEHKVDLQTMYNDFVSRDNYPAEFTKSPKWNNEKIRIETLLRHSAKSVFDVGCRTGDFLMHFPEDISREGVELNNDFAEIANKRGLKVHNDFLEKIQLSKSYDVVTCYAILEHLEKPLVFLESLTSIVEKKGLLVIMIPTFQSLKTKILSLFNLPWHMYSPPEHLNFYSRKFLDSYLKEKGFKKVVRRYSSGGMLIFNSGIMKFFDKYLTVIIDKSLLNRFPIFDHMYTYYLKIDE